MIVLMSNAQASYTEIDLRTETGILASTLHKSLMLRLESHLLLLFDGIIHACLRYCQTVAEFCNIIRYQQTGIKSQF